MRRPNKTKHTSQTKKVLIIKDMSLYLIAKIYLKLYIFIKKLIDSNVYNFLAYNLFQCKMTIPLQHQCGL